MRLTPPVFLFLLIVCFVASCQSGTEKSKPDLNKTDVSDQNGSDDSSIVFNDEELISLGMDVSKGIPAGLKVGQVAPLFTKSDVHGNEINLKSMLESGPVVLQFYRGQWCPVCTRYASSFQDSVDLILSTGAQVLAIAPESVSNAKNYISKTQLKYPVISDTDLSIMNDYAVTFFVTDDYVARIEKHLNANIPENNGSVEAKLPVPATYVINKDGKISYVQFNHDYRKRASVEAILAHL